MSAEVRIDDDFELAVADQERNSARFMYAFCRLKTRCPRGALRRNVVMRRSAAVLESQVAWGMKLLQGDGVPRDADAAARWFNMAALRGHADALNMLGRCYGIRLGCNRRWPRSRAVLHPRR